MKKIIIKLILLFMTTSQVVYAQSYYERIMEQDSIFSVYLEQDTTNYYSVYLVFENISNDSILLISSFRNFIEQIGVEPGFKMNFFLNQNPIIPNWGELPINYYTYLEGKTYIFPHSIKRFPVSLPYIGELNKNKEYGLIFDVNYRYFNFTKKEGKNYRVKTNYYKLSHLKIE